MDGANSKDKNANRVMVVATSNAPWNLGAAWKSRFSNKYHVAVPGKKKCKEVLRAKFEKVKRTYTLDIKDEDLDGFSFDHFSYRMM